MRNPSDRAVLLVSRRTLEVFVDRGPSVAAARRVVERHDASVRALAEAAREALAELGPVRDVVVALEGDLFEHRRMALPPVPPRERGAVWARRAASLLQCDPAAAVYLALPLDGADERDGAPWMLYALRREPLAELQVGLRRVGLRVRRVVLARLALLDHACRLVPDREAPFLVVARERAAISLGLLRKGGLVQHSILEADPAASTQDTSVALVQELRNLSTYWRRASRGEKLGRIVLLGFPAGFVDPLAAAIHAALGDVEILSSPDPADAPPAGERSSPSAGSGEEARELLEILDACRAEGSLRADVRVSLPPRPVRTIALSSLVALVLGLAGLPLSHGAEARLADLEHRAASLARSGSDLEDLLALEEEHARARGRLESDLARWAELAGGQVRADDLLPGVLDVFEGRARLVGLTAHAGDDGVTVELSGLAEGEAQEVYRTLEDLRVALAERFGSRAVNVLPPPRVPQEGDAMAFRITMGEAE